MFAALARATLSGVRSRRRRPPAPPPARWSGCPGTASSPKAACKRPGRRPSRWSVIG